MLKYLIFTDRTYFLGAQCNFTLTYSTYLIIDLHYYFRQDHTFIKMMDMQKKLPLYRMLKILAIKLTIYSTSVYSKTRKRVNICSSRT